MLYIIGTLTALALLCGFLFTIALIVEGIMQRCRVTFSIGLGGTLWFVVLAYTLYDSLII